MKHSEDSSPTSILLCRLLVQSGTVPSHKNSKFATTSQRSGKPEIFGNPEVRQRMKVLEGAIVSALYSSSPTTGGATGSAWLKQLRTALSGLCDDSLREIPESSFGVEYVETGSEGVKIEIEELNAEVIDAPGSAGPNRK